jgi:hypothetical protein
MNLFWFFHALMRPTYEQNMSSNGIRHREMFPRKLILSEIKKKLRKSKKIREKVFCDFKSQIRCFLP